MKVRQLSSGWWHIRKGAAWCQLPVWPCADEATIRGHTFEAEDEWRDSFIREVARMGAELMEAGGEA